MSQFNSNQFNENLSNDNQEFTENQLNQVFTENQLNQVSNSTTTNPSGNQLNQGLSDEQWNDILSIIPQSNETISASNHHDVSNVNYYLGPSTNALNGSTRDANINYINGNVIQQLNNNCNGNHVCSRPVVHVNTGATMHNIIPRNSSIQKRKRVRTAFTSTQMMYLEAEFNQNHYLERGKRQLLSRLLNLNERTIKIWFQNRRMKVKKSVIESREGEASSTTETDPDSQQQFCEQVYMDSSLPDMNQYPQSSYAIEQGQPTLIPSDNRDTTSENGVHEPNLDSNLRAINMPMQQNVTNDTNRGYTYDKVTISDIMEQEKVENANASTNWDLSWMGDGELNNLFKIVIS